MIRSGRLAWLIACFGVVGLATFATSQSAGDEKRIENPEHAVEMALTFVGIDPTPRMRSTLATSTTLTQLADSTVPILWDAGDPIEVWEVTIDEYAIGDRGLCGDKRSCKIWLAAETGEFIRAAIVKPLADTLEPMKSGQYYERKLSSPNKTVVGFSSDPPPVALADALLVPMLSAPCRASETIVWCIVLEYLDRPARPYWCIVGRSVPFLDLHGKHTNDKGETPLVNYMSIIDAETGEPMSSESVR
jgi:hypothetical protein